MCFYVTCNYKHEGKYQRLGQTKGSIRKNAFEFR